MDFQLDDVQKMLADTGARLVESHRGEGLASPGMLARLDELGLFALCLPEKLGGLGGEAGALMALMRALGAARQVAALVPMIAGGPSLLEDVAPTGPVVPALDEGETPLSTAPPKTLLRRESPGLVLNGGKPQVIGAPGASGLVVSAMLEGQTVVVLVKAGAVGLTVAPCDLVDGSPAADLTFHDLRLDDAALLAGAAAQIALARDRMRLAAASATLGAARRALDITAEHLRTREQFGGPLARFQSPRHQLAQAFVLTEELQSILFHGIAAFPDPLARPAALAAVANLSARVGQHVGETCVQLHGAIGLTEEHEMAMLFKSLMVLSGCFGPAGTELARYRALGPSLGPVDLRAMA